MALFLVEESGGEGEPVGPGRAHGLDQVRGLADVLPHLQHVEGKDVVKS